MFGRLRSWFGGEKVSPEKFQVLLEAEVREMEEKADWLEKEAETRKRMEAVRVRIKKAEGEMGRNYAQIFRIVFIGVVVLVVFILILKGCLGG